MLQMCAAQLDHFYTHGDVYDTLDTVQELEMLLGRLKRQHLLDEQDWILSKQNLAEIRARLEVHLSPAG